MRLRSITARSMLLACSCVAISGTSVRGDWTRFRGENGSGVVKGDFASSISQSDFLWTVDLPGQGHSSPVVSGGRVFLTSSDADAGERYILCLDGKSGKEIWRKTFTFEKFKQHADNSFSSATPAVDDQGVYVAWATPEHFELLSVSKDDGQTRWSVDLGTFKSQQGEGASPVLAGGFVILSNDQEGAKSGLAAFDRQTGKKRWSLDRESSDKTAMSTPVVYRPANGQPQLILTSKSRGMSSIDPATGKVLWEADKVFDARTVGSPVVAGDLIVGACGEGASHRLMVAVRPPTDDGADPEVAYSIERIAPYVPTPIAVGQRLFLWGDAGQVSCVDAATGKQIWSEKVGGMYYGSPVLVGETIWCMGRKGELVGVSASDTFHLVTKLELGEPSHASPAFSDDKLYLRTRSKLACVDMSKK